MKTQEKKGEHGQQIILAILLTFIGALLSLLLPDIREYRMLNNENAELQDSVKFIKPKISERKGWIVELNNKYEFNNNVIIQKKGKIKTLNDTIEILGREIANTDIKSKKFDTLKVYYYDKQEELRKQIKLKTDEILVASKNEFIGNQKIINENIEIEKKKKIELENEHNKLLKKCIF